MEKTIKELKAEIERVQLRTYRWQQEYSKIKQENRELLNQITEILSEDNEKEKEKTK